MKKIWLLIVCVGIAAAAVSADEEAAAPRMAFFAKTTELTNVAFVFQQGPFDEIPEAMGKLEKWFSENDYTMAGPPIGVYYDHPEHVLPDSLRWEIQIALAEEVGAKAPEGGVGVKTVQPMLVAVTYHKGAYEEVGETYGMLFAWAAKNGYQIVGAPREIYWRDPETTPTEKLLSELQIPVRSMKK
jgi:effector-binding domain-containing protein